MEEQRRLLVFFALAVAIYLGWQFAVSRLYPETASPAAPPVAASVPPSEGVAPAAEAEAPAPAAPDATTEPAEPIAGDAEAPVTVATDRFRATFTNRGAHLVSFRLENYRDDDGQPLELVRRREGGPWPFSVVGPDLEPLPLADALFATERAPLPGGGEEVRFAYRGPAGEASKVFRFRPDGIVEIEAAVPGRPGWGLFLGPGIRNLDPEAMKGAYAGYFGVVWAGDDLEKVQGRKVDAVESWSGADVSWAGLEDNYFLSVLRPEEPLAAVLFQPVALETDAEGRVSGLVRFRDEEALTDEQADLPRDLAVIFVPRGDRLVAEAYLGAKEYERLRALPWNLEETVGFGMLGVIARPLLLGLNWIHDHVVANYGWAIMLMTLLLKIVLFPLTHRSYVSMQKMQKLQPRMQAIRQRHRGKLRDKKGRMNLEAQRQMNEEIQALFREEGASPTGGCLPMILQMPIFFAFFYVLRSSVELRQEPWIFWIHDLSVPDPFWILPIVMGATQILQQRLTPAAGDPMQRRIMQLFPWMFTIFALGFPSGLVLYWTVNNILTIAQTSGYKKWRESRDAEAAGKGNPKRA